MSGRAGSSSAAWLVARAADVLRTEGLPGVATAVAAHLSYLESRLYWHADYIIHVTNTADCAVGLTAPPVDGLEVHILANERDVERLSGDGYEDVRRVVRSAARRLQKGAVGFCAFVNRDVAHVEWVAFTEAARLAIDVSPCFADHGRGEASWGGAYTVKRFRNLGIFRHVMACALRYCQEHGYQVVVGATRVRNAPSVRGQDPYGPRVRAWVRYRRFLKWSDWTVSSQRPAHGWRDEDKDRSSAAQEDS